MRDLIVHYNNQENKMKSYSIKSFSALLFIAAFGVIGIVNSTVMAATSPRPTASANNRASNVPQHRGRPQFGGLDILGTNRDFMRLVYLQTLVWGRGSNIRHNN